MTLVRSSCEQKYKYPGFSAKRLSAQQHGEKIRMLLDATFIPAR
jgi:hypothetical protein